MNESHMASCLDMFGYRSGIQCAGVARFMGSASTLRKWGVVQVLDAVDDVRSMPSQEIPDDRVRQRITEKRGRDTWAAARAPTSKRRCSHDGETVVDAQVATQRPDVALAATQSDAVFRLGVTQTLYTRTNSTTMLEQITSAARGVDGAWHDFHRSGIDLNAALIGVQAVLDQIAATSGALSLRDGYLRKHVVRKFMMAHAMSQKEPIDWGSVSCLTLKACTADEHDFLSALPSDWTCRAASEFIFHRGDLALFISLWACLWHDWSSEDAQSAATTAATRGGTREETAAEFLQSGGYQEKASRLHQLSGLWLCLAMVMAADH